MDALALGCLLAICVHEDLLPRWIVDFRWLALVAAAVVWALNMARLNEAIEFAILPLALAILMLHAIRYCDTPIYKSTETIDPFAGWGLSRTRYTCITPSAITSR